MNKDRILVVDDDPQVLPGFKRTLSEEGYEVFAVNNGKHAIELIQQKTFNLILTDIVMEGISGLQILIEIRKTSPFTPVILITGYSSLQNAEEAIRHNATDYLVKPCGKDVLKKRVAFALEKAKMEESMKMNNCLENTQEILEMFAKYLKPPLENIMQYSHLLSNDLLFNKSGEDQYPSIHTGKMIESWAWNLMETVYDMKNFNKKFDGNEIENYYSRLIDLYNARNSEDNNNSELV